MCRHLAYVGPPVPLARLLTEPAHSLYEQSWRPARQRYGTVNADGFGVGWYPLEADDGTGAGDAGFPWPARYRRAVPIWADANFPELARAVRSGAVLAAVRSATAGTTQDESAAAPFRDGRWLFSHNGAVPDWTRLPTDLTAAEVLALETHSDSALLWAMTGRRLRQGEPPGAALAAVVREVAAARPAARLNLLLTDGRTVAATAWGTRSGTAKGRGRYSSRRNRTRREVWWRASRPKLQPMFRPASQPMFRPASRPEGRPAPYPAPPRPPTPYPVNGGKSPTVHCCWPPRPVYGSSRCAPRARTARTRTP